MYEALVARICYHIQKAEFMGLKEAESTRLLKEAADAIEELIAKLNHADDQIDRLVEAEEERRWIPVEERLPEDLTRVIVFCEDGISYGLCEHLIADDEEVVEWHDFLHYPITPTHWMPLPEPPEKESEP